MQRMLAAILAVLVALAGGPAVPAPPASPDAAPACCCGALCACGPNCDCAGPIDRSSEERDESPRATSTERERTLPPQSDADPHPPAEIGRDASWPMPRIDGCPRDARTTRPRICVWLT